MIHKATYTSVWDDAVNVTTTCEYDDETHEIGNVLVVEITGVDCLTDEYVTLEDGRELRRVEEDSNEFN